MKKEKSKIRFFDTTVYYGKTTVKQFLRFGFEIVPSSITSNSESKTMMCGFSRYGVCLGELILSGYNGKGTLNEQDIYDFTINSIRLNIDGLEQGFSLWHFLELTGRSGRKGVIFLVSSYTLLVVMSFILRSEIPIEMFYVIYALPVVLLGFAILFWGLKSLFSYIYHRFSYCRQLVMFSSLFLVWNIVLSCTLQKVVFVMDVMNDSTPFLVWICIVLAIETFLAVELCWFQTQFLYRFKLRYKIIVSLINVLPAGIIFLLYMLYGSKLTATYLASYAKAFTVCLGAQLLWYTFISGIRWSTYLSSVIIDYLFSKKHV